MSHEYPCDDFMCLSCHAAVHGKPLWSSVLSTPPGLRDGGDAS